MAGQDAGDIERAITSIRELNEQLGRSAGLEFLEA
jgi:hypothetical protein